LTDSLAKFEICTPDPQNGDAMKRSFRVRNQVAEIVRLQTGGVVRSEFLRIRLRSIC
jgi:hypothetical protein